MAEQKVVQYVKTKEGKLITPKEEYQLSDTLKGFKAEKDSMIIITVDEGVVTDAKQINKPRYVVGKDITIKDLIILRQNALAHADAVMGAHSEQEEYFAFAKKCEEWIIRKGE